MEFESACFSLKNSKDCSTFLQPQGLGFGRRCRELGTWSLWACHMAQDCQGIASLPCSLGGKRDCGDGPLHTVRARAHTHGAQKWNGLWWV